jgi:aminopeptidase N
MRKLTPSSWLNEGWTVYLERRILASIHNNDSYFDFSAIIGWKHLGKCHPPNLPRWPC